MNKRQFKDFLNFMSLYENDPKHFEEANTDELIFEELFAKHFISDGLTTGLIDRPELGIQVAPKRLKIFRHMSPHIDAMSLSFTIVSGVKDGIVSYEHGGRKGSTHYKCEVIGDLIVEKIFSDHLVNGELTELHIEFNFYSEDGNLYPENTKTKIIELSTTEADDILVKRRYRVISYLKGSVKGSAFEPYIAMIFKRYKDEIDLYRDNNSSAFKDAMELTSVYEVNADGITIDTEEIVMKNILNAVYNTETGATVLQSIVFAIS